jgi:hypothetical protein
MNLLVLLKHSKKLLDLASAGLGFFHSLNSPKDRLHVRSVKSLEKRPSPRIGLQRRLKVARYRCSAR